MPDSLFSYPRKYRLVSKQDFQSVFAKSHKITAKHLIVLYKSNELGYPRLGVMLSKEKLPKAVDRNRLRRILRDSFRQQKNALKGLDIIVLLRSKCTAALSERGCKALKEDIALIWQKLLIFSK